MDYFLRRQRRRLIEDLIDLQHEEDLQRQYQSIVYNFKELDRHRLDSEDDEVRHSHHYRRKEYCLVTITYRGSNTKRKHLDEIMIIQHNRPVFKGCVQSGDQFTFKSKRYRNESQIKFKFYINELLEDEMTGCCEHGLINRNRRKNLFHIEQIVGSKPCDECEYDNHSSTSSSLTLQPSSRQNSFHNIRNTRSIQRSTNVLSEDHYDEQNPQEKSSTLVIPETTNNKALSEGFPADIAEVSDYVTQLRNRLNNKQRSQEDSTDSLPADPPLPAKRRYGPPQLSMLSVSEAPDSPSPHTREQTNNYLFNSSSSTHIQPQTMSESNVNLGNNQNRSNLSSSTTQDFQSLPLNVNSNPGEQTTTMSVNNANEIAIANDATQLLLTRLGILRQQQVERPEVSSDVALREKGNVEYFALVYLHTTYPDESLIKQLRSRVNFLKIFNDIDDCVAFINSVSLEKILLILSNSFCDTILPRIGELQQIYTIYILHENDDNIDLSSKQQPKIQGSYTNVNDICTEITNDINKISRDLILYLNISSNAISLESTFLYYQLLSEIVLDRTEIGTALKELLNFSRQEYEGNDEELKLIDEFESTYQKNQAIYWFSRPCFISKMLNKALRRPEADLLYKLRVFIQDLFQQIENESTSESLTVYLGQTIQKIDLDNLEKNILDTNLLIFPQYLFGSTDQSRATRIAKQIPTLSEEYIPVLICIDIPEGFKHANTHSRRYLVDEDNDVLLNLNTMGCLLRIEKDNIHEDQIASIHVKSVKYEDQQNIQQMLEVKRTEIKSFSPFASLIKLMITTNHQTSAEQITQAMFDDDSLKDDINIQSSIAASLHVLAASRRGQDDFQHAVELYLLSLNAFLRIILPNALELSTLYINIATMYFRLDNCEKAHEYYQKGLNIHLHSNTPDLYCVSNCSNSIGIVYLKQGQYSEAIKAFQRTLKILQQLPGSHDSEIALTLDNIGDAYIAQEKFEEALDNYSKSLEIQERIEPNNPQTLGTSYHTIGNIYLKLGQCKEALRHLQRALEYQQQYLPLGHPAFALLYNNIGLMNYRVEQYTEALQCYSKSLEIAAVSLPENHSIVGITLFNMALVYSSQDKYDEAIENIEKSTVQFLKTLPPDHPDIMDNKKYIESIRQRKMLKDIFEENLTTF